MRGLPGTHDPTLSELREHVRSHGALERRPFPEKARTSTPRRYDVTGLTNQDLILAAHARGVPLRDGRVPRRRLADVTFGALDIVRGRAIIPA